MKKYILLVSSVLLAAAACTQFEDQKPLPVENAAAPAIELVGPAQDTTFSFKVTPAEGTGFYSYAVLEGGAKELNPTTLLQVNAGGIVEGTVDYAVAPTTTVNMEKLARNAKYTIYAVAASVQGTVGEIATLEVVTTDAELPSIKAFEAKDSVMLIQFNEVVKHVETSSITAKYYAENTEEFAEGQALGTAEVKVAVEGNVAQIEVLGLYAGAYYTVSFPEGTFVDATGNKLPAANSLVGFDEEGKVAGKGLYGHMSNVNFDLQYAKDSDSTLVVNLVKPIVLELVDETVVPAGGSAKAQGTVVYESTDVTHTYKSTYDSDFWWAADGKVEVIPNYEDYTGRPDPLRGDDVTVTIAEGALFDIYGNVNNEFVMQTFLYSYGYNVEDIYGTWVNDGSVSGLGVAEDPWSFTVEASDDEEAGNVMVTSYYGLNTLIYGNFDVDMGTLAFSTDYEPLEGFVHSSGAYYLDFYNLTNTVKEITFVMPALGTLEGDDWIGYYYDLYAMPESGKVEDIDWENGWVDYGANLFAPMFTKSEDPAPAPSAAPARRAAAKGAAPLKDMVFEGPRQR